MQDEGPYRGYHADDFNTVKLDAPIRGAAAPPHVTSTFDRPPVRVGGPASDYMTSNFDEAPVRLGPMHVYSQPVTGEFDAPPVRASPTSTMPMAPAMQPSTAERQKARLNSYGSWGGLSKGWLLADVVLRVLTLVCAVIAVALLPGFISKVQEVNSLTSLSISTASPKYEVAIAALGILYSAFGSIVASICYFSGNLILGDATHLIFYIGDQVFVCLFLTAGSAGASYLMALSCSDTSTCGNGSGGAAMLFIAFALSFGNFILSSISFYKRKT